MKQKPAESPYPEIFDTIIIGAGPAGMTAAIYAARRKLKTLVITADIGGQMRWCSDIQNWTGVAQSTGPALSEQFYQHLHQMDEDDAQFDLWFRENERVAKVEKSTLSQTNDQNFTLTTDRGEAFITKTIICATGRKPRTLGIPGEKEAMNGRGLSFAATSDAPLYAGKKMVVIGGGNSAMDVALQLAKYTDDITICTNLDHLIGEQILMEKVEQNPAIKVRYLVQTDEIILDDQPWVSGVKIRVPKPAVKASNVAEIDSSDLIDETIPCQGVFEEIGHVPATSFLAELVRMNSQNEIQVNRLMHTSVPGIFAAGDCNDGVHKQVVVAAGEGAVAALQAHEYLLKNKQFK